MSSSFSSYAEYLTLSNSLQQLRQSQLYPSRQISTNATSQYWPAVEPHFVNVKLNKLSEVMELQEDLIPLLIDEEEHFDDDLSRHKIYNLLSNLALAVPVMVIR